MPKKILLADDSITIQKVVELTFSDGDYEVTAVNNGAKALQKLSEMRPDIILSDIIMPEKNGYEVCEYVKSHPEFRTIPVVLLTGTFEPFDPDRAEKAGCDAVVTKPFESQSLIHKVEELISQAAHNVAPASEPVLEQEAAPSPWMDEPAPAPAPEHVSPFTTSGGSFPTPPDAFTHDSDIFGAAAPTQQAPEMPFETPSSSPFAPPAHEEAFSSETRAFTKMNFEEMQPLASPPPPPPLAEPSPWDEPADLSGETRAFTKMSFDDFQTPPPPPSAPQEPEMESPFGTSAPDTSVSADAFRSTSFDDAPQAEASTPFASPEPPSYQAAASEPEPEVSPWDEPPASPFAGETRAFPKMSFDELQQLSSAQTPPPPPAPEPAADSPWGAPETPAYSGETRAFPKMSFDELQQLSSSAPAPEPEPERAPWEEPTTSTWTPAEEPATAAWSAPPEPEPAAWAPAEEPVTPAWSQEEQPAPSAWSQPEEPAPSAWQPAEEPAAPQWSLDDHAAEPVAEPEEPAAPSTVPFAEPEPQFGHAAFDAPAVPEELPFASTTSEESEPEVESEPLWAPAAAASAAAESAEPVVPPAVLAPAPAFPQAESASLPIARADLSDEQVDRIARRVIELMSDQVVRNIAWEVIPDLAEMVVKERIRQLEAEA